MDVLKTSMGAGEESSGGVVRACVVGAGAAGLCAARHCTAPGSGVSAVVYEQTGSIGGTWVYNEATDIDPDTGLPVHSSMYKSLSTNLPKEVMGFPDFPIPDQDLSYIPAADILHFLNLYADNFDVRKHIKFHHYVKRIEPKDNGWSVTVTDLKTNTETTEYFDAVMICNGHYHTPRYPFIPGTDSFPGLQLHSHQYRVPDPLANQRVVVFGAGPSGMDLALEISSVAKQVILSHHLQDEVLTKFPDNVVQKPDIRSVEGSTVVFKDGSRMDADVLFYCTGYQYSFPFLSPECSVTVKDNHVQPLYKHLVNIHRPTMCFVGLPFYVCAFTMFDVQVQYFLRSLKREFRLPSSSDMSSHTAAEAADRLSRGLTPRQFHMMGPQQARYYDSLSSEAGLRPVAPVMTALHNHSSDRFRLDIDHYRQDIFRIVDDNSFVQVK